MTAMMAFFLVLWIVNSTSKETQSAIARYFNPIKISDTTPAPRGLKDGKDTDFDASLESNTKELSKSTGSDDKSRGAAGSTASATANLAKSSELSKLKAENEELTLNGHSVAELESELRTAPDLALDRISRSGGKGQSAAELDQSGISDSPKTEVGEYRDPFAGGDQKTRAKDARSVDRNIETKTEPTAAAGVALNERAASIKAELSKVMSADPELKRFREPLIQSSNGTTAIMIVDSEAVSLFAVGSSVPTPKGISLIESIGAVLLKNSNKIIIQGHTDSRQFRSGSQSNWRLSAERAVVTYHILRRSGIAEGRFIKIEGYADSSLRVAKDPSSAENRRIQIDLVEAQ